jgi:hypothetical protein
MRFYIVHELLEGKFAVKLYEFAEPFEIKIKQNAVSDLSPFSNIILAAVKAYACSSLPLSPMIKGLALITVTKLRWHIHGKGYRDEHWRL